MPPTLWIAVNVEIALAFSSFSFLSLFLSPSKLAQAAKFNVIYERFYSLRKRNKGEGIEGRESGASRRDSEVELAICGWAKPVY